MIKWIGIQGDEDPGDGDQWNGDPGDGDPGEESKQIGFTPSGPGGA